jgi:hypothetical protein
MTSFSLIRLDFGDRRDDQPCAQDGRSVLRRPRILQQSRLIRPAIEQLSQRQAKVLGLIVNRADSA